MKILIDNGHGENTPGKRSPDGLFREYKFAREMANEIVTELRNLGFDASRIVTEERDISLSERCRRVNSYCNEQGPDNVLLVSIHCNAAGDGTDWHNASGWSAHISLNASSASKRFATKLAKAARKEGLKVRTFTPNALYWPQNLAICRDTRCAAVLTENLFMDNKLEVSELMSLAGRSKIKRLHVNGIIDYIKSITE